MITPVLTHPLCALRVEVAGAGVGVLGAAGGTLHVLEPDQREDAEYPPLPRRSPSLAAGLSCAAEVGSVRTAR